MNVIEASRDLKALERLCPLYIEQATSQAESDWVARRNLLRRSAAIDPARLERTDPAPVIPYAFRLWIDHLGWLDSIGINFTLDDLTPEEATGLALLRRAREKFWRDHSSCPQCQSINLRAASFCGGCGAQFQ